MRITSDVMSEATAIGDSVRMPSSPPRIAHSTVHTAAATMAILSTPLARLLSPSSPNIRLRPLKRESFDRLGFSRSVEKTGRCCSKCPASAAPIRTANTGARSPAHFHRMPCSSTMMPPASTAIWSGCSRNTRKKLAKPAAVEALKIAIASVAPTSVTNTDTSVLLTTSPCSCACSSLRCVGSSVLWASSRSSAISAEARHLGAEIVHEHHHHRADQQHQQQEPGQDVDRRRDEEDRQWRHQPRQQAHRRTAREAEDG